MTHKKCPLPFSQVFVQSSGKVFPCSFLQNHTELGDVKTTSFSQIWRGEKMQSFRQAHEKGEYTQCEKNQRIYKCHESTPWLKIEDITPDAKGDYQLKRVDFMTDSTCNLACIMCTNIFEDRGGFESENFWEDAQKHMFPHLIEVEIIGGEPFISRETYKLIEKVNEVNQECRWNITTNGAYNFGKKIRSTLDSIKLNKIGYSIDSLKNDVFADIRKGGSLSQTLKTLEHYIQYNQSLPPESRFILECNFVVQQKNAFEVPSFIDFAVSKGIGPYLIFLNHPRQYSLLNIPKEQQSQILSFYLDDLEKKPHPQMLKLCWDFFNKLSEKEKIKHIDRLASLPKKVTHHSA